MPGLIILRFGDSEEPSIPAHERVIDTQRSTWWGWWKKREEPFPSDLLQDLQSTAVRDSVEIGLVNRKGVEQYCVATCVDVRFSQDGTPIPSPDPALTPTYYNTGRFPAWFNFTRIEVVKKQRWEEQFKIVPYLDPTFYEVVQEGGEYRMLPQPTWSMVARETPGECVLHISDLHFGEDHGFPPDRSTPGSGVDRRPLWEILSARLLQQLRASIGVVVVSGDLITRGKADGYADADHCLRKLLETLKLEPDHCVIVPGNHDLYTADLVNPTRQYAHEGSYRLFLRGFFKMDFQDLERVRRFRTRAGRELIFIELNSARIRSDFLREYGFVAKHRYARLMKFVRETLAQDHQGAPPVFFAVLHHHILPVSPLEVPEDKHPVSLCLDAGELIEEFQSFGINFALHGHQHMPFIGETSRVPRFDSGSRRSLTDMPLYVLGSGSSGAKRDRLPRDFEWNTYSVYTPLDGGLNVMIERYTDMRMPETLWKGVLPLRTADVHG